jgi:hypothetical protein
MVDTPIAESRFTGLAAGAAHLIDEQRASRHRRCHLRSVGRGEMRRRLHYTGVLDVV